MPVIPTRRQKEIFKKLKQYLKKKGYEYLDYNGPNDDSYKFGDDPDPIRCYIKFISVNARRRNLKESVLVVVRPNEKNENVEEFLVGNDFHGQGGRRVFILPGDNDSYNRALRLIGTI